MKNKNVWRRPNSTPARMYAAGMGEAVANRTINRKIDRPTSRVQNAILSRQDSVSLDDHVAAFAKSQNVKISGYDVLHGDDHEVEVNLHVIADIEVEKWADVAYRVAIGNSMLHKGFDMEGEFNAMHHHLRQASLLMSGRHLQHGDADQPSRNMEVFTNCSTAAASFLGFYLLLNGSGVGRCYDDQLLQVDWRKAPTVVTVIDGNHKDAVSGEISAPDYRTACHMYSGKTIHNFRVEDSREGWAHAIEKLETMTHAGTYHDDVLILDFSDVRPRGAPIGGMQNRPASGPGPLMYAINMVAKLRDAGMAPWRSTMFADHYFAECVLVGGARRAARMATKIWTDATIFDFIQLKRGGFLWSSNNSVMVDTHFWDAVKQVNNMLIKAGHSITDKAAFDNMVSTGQITITQEHAWKVLTAIVEAAYYDGTGEPGLITVDRLTWNEDGIETLLQGDFVESEKMKLTEEGQKLLRALAQKWAGMRYKVITNPCGEIVLNLLGAYCVIADVVPFHAGYINGEPLHETNEDWDNDAEDAFRTATRALIRTNLMNSMYGKEVARTNRIGVSMTGIHEYAFTRFGYGWKDLVNESKSLPFWLMLSRFKRAVQNESVVYSGLLGVSVPHTDTTLKPAGTTSKLFGLTEAAHLPSMREFLRWVQFRNDDPLIESYRKQNYPVRVLKSYSGTTIVGFPTKPTICTLGMGAKLVTAAEATPEEQYQWLRLLEKYWIVGVAEDGVTPLKDTGNQVSYTLKYDPKKVDFETFVQTLLKGQSTIRCCSVMPQTDSSAYEYQPEQPVTKAEYERICAEINQDEDLQEDIGVEHVDCASGACPINFGANVATETA